MVTAYGLFWSYIAIGTVFAVRLGIIRAREEGQLTLEDIGLWFIVIWIWPLVVLLMGYGTVIWKRK